MRSRAHGALGRIVGLVWLGLSQAETRRPKRVSNPTRVLSGCACSSNRPPSSRIEPIIATWDEFCETAPPDSGKPAGEPGRCGLMCRFIGASAWALADVRN